MSTAHEVHLVRRPHGVPDAQDFSLVERELPAPGAGEVEVANRAFSVDPYMRGRMNDTKSYVPPFALDAPMDGGAVGVVEQVGASATDGPGHDVKVGDTVLHNLGWRTHAVLPGRHVRVIDTEVDGAPVQPQAYLGVLGMPGLTAYVGLLRIADFREGDRVFVSAAAGAVGSLVGQIARLRGAALVVGSAGGPEKAAWLVDEAGFDQGLDYRAQPIRTSLRQAAPDGIDVYFDNVGGDHLEAALGVLRQNGRAALCGAVAQYNDTEPPAAPRNLALVVGQRLTLRGFIVSDHGDLRPDFEREVGGWLRDGRIVWRETVVDGIDNAWEAFRSLLTGGNTGKMLVRL